MIGSERPNARTLHGVQEGAALHTITKARATRKQERQYGNYMQIQFVVALWSLESQDGAATRTYKILCDKMRHCLTQKGNDANP